MPHTSFSPATSPGTSPGMSPGTSEPAPELRTLRARLGALRDLVSLSGARLDAGTLDAASRLLDEAAARDRLPAAFTTVALAGATGGGKSSLFNALAGAQLSETGVRRPTTATALSCVWDTPRGGDNPEGLLERLGIAPRFRRRPHCDDPALGGLILVDLPDLDSVDPAHREQTDRLLGLVDAIIWVTDPEKYADALLHERYLRAFAGHAEVSVVVLNQADRLPGDAVDAVLDDLRRLLDEGGVPLGEHGEPGARVLAVSALTGEGIADLRRDIADLVSTRATAARRLAADVDGLTRQLRPHLVPAGGDAPAGLTSRVRQEFEDRLAVAVGAPAAGETAERAWLRRADHACGTPWARLLRRLAWHQAERRGEPHAFAAKRQRAAQPPAVSRPAIEEAVRRLAEDAARGLPRPWAEAVARAARRGAADLPAALDEALATQPTGIAPRPRWWSAAAAGQAGLVGLQLLGLCWLVTALVAQPVVGRWLPFMLLAGGALAGPLLAWACRVAARGGARAFGHEEESRLRRLAAEQGHRHVLEPVAAELMRYQEAAERYHLAAGPPGGAQLPV
ncbi:GTPase [Streptomyces sp. 7-21]|uniref:GTPase n=1 Tax=Streptomyces sp. 7-21 TaxID=2802283 RepID=UPI00191E82A6|nr:GTPase [Streptomyces sp. 7-21]MBL1066474.1 50S ribosome-binding GTPase [Streptomyces sp. 7-21]